MVSVTCHAIVTKPYCLYFRNSDSVPFSSSLPPAPSSKVQAGLPGFLQSSCNWGSGIYPAFPPLFLPLQGRVIFSKCQWILSPFKDPHYSLPRSTKIPSVWLRLTNPNPVLFQTTFLLSHPLFSSHTRFLSSLTYAQLSSFAILLPEAFRLPTFSSGLLTLHTSA